MDTPRPSGERVPLGDLTNTTHGHHDQPKLMPGFGDPYERNRQKDRERDAKVSDEIMSERRNKHLQTENNQDVNTTNEPDENSDWLHRPSTYSNGLQQLSDDPVPISINGGPDDVHDAQTEEEISGVVICPKERKGKNIVYKVVLTP